MIEQEAHEHLSWFIAEIDAQVRTTWRQDLADRWGGADAIPLYPTDADLPATTVGPVRAVVVGYARLQQENERLRAEQTLLAHMRVAEAKVKASTAMLAVCLGVSVAFWLIWSQLLPVPWSVLASWASGTVMGFFVIPPVWMRLEDRLKGQQRPDGTPPPKTAANPAQTVSALKE